MTQLINLKAAKWEDEATLRKFMRDNRLPNRLARRIWNTYRHQRSAKDKKLRKQDIDSLVQMPMTLQVQLSAELHKPSLQHMPIFAAAGSSYTHDLSIICYFAFSERLGSPSQEVFHSNMRADSAICLLHGSMGYESAKLRHGRCTVHMFEWVCEGALWGNWVTRGNLASNTDTSRVELSAEKLRSVVTRHCNGFLWQAFRQYVSELADMVDLSLVSDVIEDESDRKIREGIAIRAFASTGECSMNDTQSLASSIAPLGMMRALSRMRSF
uniref:Uncharacterized protein n=1 Tax=Zooxanthella nutricula TaxID=1333877 RepID=A0A7S2K0N5_9DINO